MGYATTVHYCNFRHERPHDTTLMPHNARRLWKIPDMVVEPWLTTPTYAKFASR